MEFRHFYFQLVLSGENGGVKMSGLHIRKSDQDGCHCIAKTGQAEAKKEENRTPDETFLTSIIALYLILQIFKTLAVQMAVPGRNPCHTPIGDPRISL